MPPDAIVPGGRSAAIQGYGGIPLDRHRCQLRSDSSQSGGDESDQSGRAVPFRIPAAASPGHTPLRAAVAANASHRTTCCPVIILQSFLDFDFNGHSVMMKSTTDSGSFGESGKWPSPSLTITVIFPRAHVTILLATCCSRYNGSQFFNLTQSRRSGIFTGCVGVPALGGIPADSSFLFSSETSTGVLSYHPSSSRRRKGWFSLRARDCGCGIRRPVG